MTDTHVWKLTDEEIVALVQRVFQPRPSEKTLAILTDLPHRADTDHADWQWRRQAVVTWARQLDARREKTGWSPSLVVYRNVGANNADLPNTAWTVPAAVWRSQPLTGTVEEMDESQAEPFAGILGRHPIHIACTEFSATAPLKLAARQYNIRAATMPGFTASMIPALRLDYTEINRRVFLLKELLDRAEKAEFVFVVDADKEYRLTLDLRFRTAHASGGLLPESGTAGNLPSGEAYIVPYEGEKPGETSRSAGELPVQIGDDIVIHRIENNRSIAVLGDNAAARDEAEHLKREPAYGNMSELGLGVLGELGVEPVGELLLDEKLGLHIAFGRSDHFGGQVGAAQFSGPEAVIHLDRVYVPSMQPRIRVRRVDLLMDDGCVQPLIRDDEYVVGFT